MRSIPTPFSKFESRPREPHPLDAYGDFYAAQGAEESEGEPVTLREWGRIWRSLFPILLILAAMVAYSVWAFWPSSTQP